MGLVENKKVVNAKEVEFGVVVDGKVVFTARSLVLAQKYASKKHIDKKGNMHDVYIIDRKVEQ